MQPTLEAFEPSAPITPAKVAARRTGDAPADFAESLAQARQREEGDPPAPTGADVAESAQDSQATLAQQAPKPDPGTDESDGAPNDQLEAAAPEHEADQESPLVEAPAPRATSVLQADVAAGQPVPPATPEFVSTDSQSEETEARRGGSVTRALLAPRDQAPSESAQREPAQAPDAAQPAGANVRPTRNATEQSISGSVDAGSAEKLETDETAGAARRVSDVTRSPLPVSASDAGAARAPAPEVKAEAPGTQSDVRAEGHGREERAASRGPRTNVVQVEVEAAPDLDEEPATVARVERPIVGLSGAGQTAAPARVEASVRSVEAEPQPRRGEPPAPVDPTASTLRSSPVAVHATAPGLTAGPRSVLAPGSETAQAGQPADARAIEAQVTRGLMAAVRQNGGSLTIRLNPPMLGTVKVQMQLEGGVVGARIEVGVAQAHELLKGSIDSLRSALEGKGLQVERLSVHLSPGQSQPQQDQGRQEAQHGGGDRQGAHDSGDGRSRGSFDGREDRAGARGWRESGDPRSENGGEAAGGFAARLRLRLDAIA